MESCIQRMKYNGAIEKLLVAIKKDDINVIKQTEEEISPQFVLNVWEKYADFSKNNRVMAYFANISPRYKAFKKDRGVPFESDLERKAILSLCMYNLS